MTRRLATITLYWLWVAFCLIFPAFIVEIMLAYMGQNLPVP